MVRDARPYFYSSEYAPVKCDFEYGSPSGHAQAATSFFLTFLTLVLKEYNIKKHKKLLYAVVLLYCGFIGFTRIVVGLHTLEQILTGFGFGITIHIVVSHLLAGHIERIFVGIETRKVGFINPLSILYLLSNFLAIGLYLVVDWYYPSPQDWLDMIEKVCKGRKKFITLHYE